MAAVTKKEMIDYIVWGATLGQFFGDRRDSEARPITWLNFKQEILRYGAKALRERLSRLSYQEVSQEWTVAVEEMTRREEQATEATLKSVARHRKVAAASASKRNVSQSIDEVVAEFAGPLLDKHPTWSSLRCAVEIEPRVNEALRAQGRRQSLGHDAIRKRVKKFRTHQR